MKPVISYLISVACVLVLSVSFASAQTTRPASTRPTTAPADDVLKGVVDPYDAGAERTKFFAACGKENELTEDAFNADQQKGGGFARKFDRWKALLAFDKNSNGKIDWFEADAYRLDLRKKVLAVYDKDKTGELKGDQREAAIKRLASGKAVGGGGGGGGDIGRWDRGDAGGADRGDSGKTGGDPAVRKAKMAELLKKYDADGDGKLTDEERDAMIKDISEQQHQEMMAKYDKNADGKLDDEELKAMQEERRDRQKEFRERAEAIKLKHFDADGDGKLGEDEQKAFKDFEQDMQKVGKSWELAVFDTDGDGKVSDEERQQVQKEAQRAALRMMAMGVKYMDADGDGKVSAEEREAFEKKVQEGTMDWFEKKIASYDTDGDEKLTTKEERQALIDGLQDELTKRKEKYDKNADGRLSPNEMLDMMDDFAKEIGLKASPRFTKDKAATQKAQE